MIVTRKYLLFVGILVVLSAFLVTATGGYTTDSRGNTYGINQSGAYVQAEDVIIEDAIVAAATTSNIMVMGNLNVTGCIIYMSVGGSPTVLGVCE